MYLCRGCGKEVQQQLLYNELVAQLPAHTHGRGTTDIKGTWEPNGLDTDGSRSGCFLDKKHNGNGWLGHNSKGGSVPYISFQASSGWFGTSQSIGSGSTHNHTFTGTQYTITNLPPYKTVYCFYRVS